MITGSSICWQLSMKPNDIQYIQTFCILYSQICYPSNPTPTQGVKEKKTQKDKNHNPQLLNTRIQ